MSSEFPDLLEEQRRIEWRRQAQTQEYLKCLDYMRGRNGGLPPPTFDDVWSVADQSGSAPEAENAPEHAPENAPAEEFPSS